MAAENIPAIQNLTEPPVNYQAGFQNNRVEYQPPDGAVQQYACAPLLRPTTITNLLTGVGRKIKLLCPVFVDCFLPPNVKENAQYIATIAGLIVPEGARTTDYSALVTVQACAVGYSPADCGTPTEAFEAVVQGILSKRHTFNAQMTAALTPQGGVIPPWVADGGDIPPANVAIVISQLAREEATRAMTLSIFATGLLAYCKQGNASTNVINKITNAARDELGVNINLNPNIIRNFWNMCGPWFNDQAAKSFFTLWETAIGQHSLRFRLLCQQASWGGMTNFTNIRTARSDFPDFDWAACAKLFGGEMDRFRAAEAAVGDNEYYGYRRDLGPAKSTNFPNLAYAAYALLVNVKGDRMLREFLGTNRNTPHAGAIDILVREYEQRRLANVRERPAEAQVGTARVFLDREPWAPAPEPAPQPPPAVGGPNQVIDLGQFEQMVRMFGRGMAMQPEADNNPIAGLGRGQGGPPAN